jgi:hypothetical protein
MSASLAASIAMLDQFMVSVALAHHPLGFFRPAMAHAG